MRGLLLSFLFFTSSAVAESREFRVEAFCAGAEPSVKSCVADVDSALHLLNEQLAGVVHFRLIAVRETPGEINEPAPYPLYIVNAVTSDWLSQDGADLGVALFPDTNGDNVRGISFLGTLGITPATLFARATGRSFTVDVIAHEIGHSLGADHDVKGLMTPALSDYHHSRRLSHKSLEEIKKHLTDISPS